MTASCFPQCGGGIYFFAGVLIVRRWQRLKVAPLQATSFAFCGGTRTAVHQDGYDHGREVFAT